jgi:TatD DNase family protein
MILTETDGPVTYSGPYKGRSTKPSFVIEIIQKLAEIKSLEIDATREAIHTNFEKFITKQI